MSHFDDLNFCVQQIARKEKIKDYDAFVLFVLRDLMGLEDAIYQEALQAGGPKDCGIDAFWNDEESIYILQSKFYNPKNKIKETEIENLYNTVLYLENSNDPALKNRCKKYILEKGFEYRDLKNEGKEVHFIFATTSCLSSSAKTKLQLLRKKSPSIKFDIWDLEEVYAKYSVNQKPQKPDVTFKLVGNECFSSTGVLDFNAPYVVATLRGEDLFRAYKQYKEAIFAQNLRYYLGKGGKINKEIRSTIEDPYRRQYFWYYNNGLTIVCDKFKINKQRELVINNLQIVNGGQTTKSIYETLLSIGDKGAGDLKVIARIIQTSDNEDLISGIRDFNNRQNPTKPRDFIAHNKKQRSLQVEFKRLGYFYEIGRGERNEHGVSREIKQKKLTIIDNLTVAQAQYSFSGYPAEAKSQKGALLAPDQSHFNSIFPERIMAQELLFSYICYNKAKESYLELKRQRTQLKEDEEYLIHGTTHIVAVMGAIAKEVFDLGSIFKSPERYEKLIDDKVVDKIYDFAQWILSDIYSNKLNDCKLQNKALVPSKYFKNSSDASLIMQQANFRIGRNKEIKELEKMLNK